MYIRKTLFTEGNTKQVEINNNNKNNNNNNNNSNNL